MALVLYSRTFAEYSVIGKYQTNFVNFDTYLTSDAIKIEPNTKVFYYCLWFDFYSIRR